MDGAGIPPDKLDIIQEPFVRLEGTEEIKGFGLGLSITKGIIEVHGGRLQIESRSNRANGAIFTLILPGAYEAKE
jgi:signal transduction histidine kinase